MASWATVWTYLAVYLCAYFLIFFVPAFCLECYNCERLDAVEQCLSDGSVAECPYGYDSCYTETLFRGNSSEFEPLTMTKGCITGASCADRKSVSGECVVRDSDFVCVSCCTGQRCNRSASSDVTMATASVTVIVWALVSAVAVSTPCRFVTRRVSRPYCLPR